MPSTGPIDRTKAKLIAGDDVSAPPVAMDSADRGSPAPPLKRRVMVIADPSRESSVALQWALSHAILEQDELILLHVEMPNPSRRGGALSAFLRRPASLGSAGSQQHHHQLALSSTSSSSSSSSSAGSGDAGEYEFLEVMRVACEAAQPKVRVQVEKVEMEGREKAATILSQTKMLGVDLLVIGQRRSGSSFLGSRAFLQFIITYQHLEALLQPHNTFLVTRDQLSSGQLTLMQTEWKHVWKGIRHRRVLDRAL